jgi:zinc/manganese transport system substrate-binding protein
MRNQRFQIAVMNDTEPRASDVAAFQDDLRNHIVRLLLYNSQATGAASQRLLKNAEQSNVPVVGVTETQPPGMTWQSWMMSQLDAVARALAKPPS